MATIPFEAVRRWTFDEALPFWASEGLDGPGRGFVEHLAADGAPANPPFKRMRAQARQIYVFSHAATLGFKDGLRAAEAGYEFITRHGWLESGGWASRMGRDGGVLDPSLDLYEEAFALFALAWWHRASGDPQAVVYAERTLDAIERRMAHPSGRGFVSVAGRPGPSLQNPHMHLLEAVLAAYDFTGRGRFAEAARDLVRLFETTLYDPATRTLAEEFDDRWARVRGPEGVVIEPGHHFEWAWLLDRHDRLTGEDHSAVARDLFDFAERYGVDRQSGVAFDQVSDQGAMLKASMRLWPQTELIKARVARAEGGVATDLEGLARGAQLVLDRYLTPAPHGCWWDQLDEHGAFVSGKIPATSLYHLFLGFSELLRVQPQLEAAAVEEAAR